MSMFLPGQRLHLVDKKGRHYALTLKAGAVFEHSGETLSHDDLIGKPDGTMVQLSRGKKMIAVYPTLGEYTLKMPRGAQVLYPKDLAMILVWADIFPGARVFEAGVGSGALTLALLRAVGEGGQVVGFETRDEFARTAMKNIERYLGGIPSQLTVLNRDAYEGIALGDRPEAMPFDRVVLDLPEPWRVVPHAVSALRLGGIFLSFVPTIPQVMHTVEALERSRAFALIHTFETLSRSWNIQGRSVRPDLRMIGHSGFLTVARRVEKLDSDAQDLESNAEGEEDAEQGWVRETRTGEGPNDSRR
ncbi:MAG: tRNA (adenine-N1)-methyltransferase [Nitrospirae bacterium]|nr:MAG: tRNA (adenine-N1)-methyltransferase [Nitrospirota bacterium]